MAIGELVLVLPHLFFDPFVVLHDVSFPFFINPDFADIMQQPADRDGIIGQFKVITCNYILENCIDVPGVLGQSPARWNRVDAGAVKKSDDLR
jgi:hypothetical protein